jgi:hypothetical protein
MAVGFFTQGIQFALPHPPIPERMILLVCKVIRQAWQLLADHPPENFHLQSEKEDVITQVLVEIIENRLRKSGEVAGFNHAFFGKVFRGPEITNFDKNHPDKEPDIFFDLKRENYPVYSDQDGLFVECKPVDKDHPLSSCYCQKGLIRFVNGDYAWAMKESMMVGYVAGGYTFNKLAAVLNDAKLNADLKTKNHSEVMEHAIYRSSHEREFNWLEHHGPACTISVTHLWLQI